MTIMFEFYKEFGVIMLFEKYPEHNYLREIFDIVCLVANNSAVCVLVSVISRHFIFHVLCQVFAHRRI